MNKGGIRNGISPAEAHVQGVNPFKMNEGSIRQLPAARDVERMDAPDMLKRGIGKFHLLDGEYFARYIQMPDTPQMHKVFCLQIESPPKIGADGMLKARPPQIKTTCDARFHIPPPKRCYFITQLFAH